MLTWLSWCGPRPGPLRISITLQHARQPIDGPFDGPPDYNFVPGCLQRAPTIHVLAAYVR